jgi:small subunit ribosomal protein S2
VSLEITHMASLVQELIEAGIHFGQRRSNWNPKMAPYIHGVRNQIHILDVRESIKGLLLAKRFIEKTIGDGKDVCFVGTKRQARGPIEQYAADVGMPFVTERWLGGTLTNFRTIRERLKRLEELDRLVETGEMKSYSKKMESQLLRERKKIQRNLGGVRQMTRLPGALIAIDTSREKNALLEARSLGIPTVCLVDTDGDPDLVNIPIPGNDDSMRTIDLIVRELCDAVRKGKEGRATSAGESPMAEGERGSRSEGPADGPAPRRRSSRSQFRAVGAAATAEAPAEAPAQAPAEGA